MKNSYPTAEDWINYYSMDPHPEGGYFKEIYRAETQITSECLPNKFNKSHSLATSIYFLLKQ
ncbi:MAG: cupin domain-containing protein, partial [Promethearchaeota archaeon]